MRGTMRVLLVEDDQDMVELLEILLREMAGWEVSSVMDPQQVLDEPKLREHVDLALVDLCMEPLRGPELVRRLQQQDALSFPVVYLTGQRPSPDDLALVEGAVQKPFTFHELMQQLERILGDRFPA